jgi:hypothetical protein
LLLSDIALVVTAIGVVGIMLGLRQNNLERMSQLEAMYIKRYWSILDSMSLDTRTISELSTYMHHRIAVVRSSTATVSTTAAPTVLPP